MNTFNYRAKDKLGKVVLGQIEAVDDRQAAVMLRNRGLFVVDIKIRSGLLEAATAIRGGVSEQELANFTRYLATMLSTGLPLTDALSNLQSQASAALGEIIASVTRDISGGLSMSEAMGRFPKTFNHLYVSLVKAGETSGTVDEALSRLADTLEKQIEFKGKIKGAMVYPIIVVAAMFGIGGVMMTVVIPKISEVYKDFGSDLPLPTKILIMISDFLVHYTWLAGIIVAGIVALFIYYKRTPMGEYQISNLSYKLPIFGSLNKDVTFAVVCRTLGALVGSGIAILDALKIVANVAGNNIYRDGLTKAQSEVEKGFPLSMSLKNNPNYPSLIAQMVGIGEETGTIDQSLFRLASFYESSAERKVKVLTTALEPLLILVMGVGVGGLAIAVLLPMFNLVNVIK
jgi:type IV pilus assembly protein PilC